MTGPTKTGNTKTAAKAKDAAICDGCWPDGWPSEGTNAAGCVHGSWSRDI